jgi:tetratricopeptide (TPR) repeat protein
MQDAMHALPIMGPKGSATARFNEAFRLIPNQKFAEAVTTFEALAREYPERAGTAYSQVGAALYFLGRYEEALVHYRRALELGKDVRTMNDNIVEAEEAIRKRRV